MTKERLKSIWPEWRLEDKPLGRGSYGAVYKAVRNDHGVESASAVKIISIPRSEYELDTLRSEGFSEGAATEYFEKLVDDYVGEIRMMESFKGTQHIVSVEDYAVAERENGIGWDIFIRMELLTPFTSYAPNGELSETEAIRLGIDICSALELLGKKNVIHRDIKPQNIFVNEFGDFKLGDFGIARDVNSVLSKRGTPNYMAPEILTKKQYDARADIYSLGMVLYTVMNKGRMPFLDPNRQLVTPAERENANRRRIGGEPLPPPVNASAEFAALIACACSPDPETRFSSPAAFKRALVSLSPDPMTVYYPPEPAVPTGTTAKKTAEVGGGKKKKPGRRRLVVLGVILLALMLSAGLFVFGMFFGMDRIKGLISDAVGSISGSETDSGETPPPMDANTAYAAHIRENRESIDLYFWQNGWNGRGSPSGDKVPRQIAIENVWGDEVPELIYIDAVRTEDGSGGGYASKLHILTFLNGGLVTLFEKDWDTKDDPINYAFYKKFDSEFCCAVQGKDEERGAEYLLTVLSFISDAGNSLSVREALHASKWPGNSDIQVWTDSFSISQGEVYLKDYFNKVSAVFQTGGGGVFDQFVTRKSSALTADEAISLLEDRSGSGGESAQDAGSVLSGTLPGYRTPRSETTAIDLRIGLGGEAVGTINISDKAEYQFSFTLKDPKKDDAGIISFTVSELSAGILAKLILKDYGIKEGAELAIYPAGTDVYSFPTELMTALLEEFKSYNSSEGLLVPVMCSDEGARFLRGYRID